MTILAAWTGLASGSIALAGGVLVWWGLPRLIGQFAPGLFLIGLTTVAWYLYTLGLAGVFLSAGILIRGRGETSLDLRGQVGNLLTLTGGSLTLAAAIVWLTGGVWDDVFGAGTMLAFVQGGGLLGPALFTIGIALSLWTKAEIIGAWKFRRPVALGSLLAGSAVLAGAVLLFVGRLLNPGGISRWIPVTAEFSLLAAIFPTPAWLLAAYRFYRFGLAAFAFVLAVLLGGEVRGVRRGLSERLAAWTGIAALVGSGAIAFLGAVDVTPSIPRPSEFFLFPGLPFIVPYLVLGLLACGLSLVLWSLRPRGTRARSA